MTDSSHGKEQLHESGLVKQHTAPAGPPESDAGRSFLSTARSTTMAAGPVAGYGTLGFSGSRFVIPKPRGDHLGCQSVNTLDRLAGLQSRQFTAPSGIKIIGDRRGDVWSATVATTMGDSVPATPLTTPEIIEPKWIFDVTFRWSNWFSLTSAVISSVIFVALMFHWPRVDSLWPRITRNHEICIDVVRVAALLLSSLTIWGAVADHESV